MITEHPVTPTHRQEVHEKERALPLETTHKEQLEHIFDSLANHNYAVVIGPSHAGKTTFLRESLRVALEKNGYDAPVLLDCMTALPDEIIAEMTSNTSMIVLDESSRMIHNPAFLQALKDRISLRYPAIICATLFDGEITEESELGTLLSELHLDQVPDAVTDFPLSMTKNDALVIAGGDLPDASSEFIEELTELTTQPYLMKIITCAVRKNPNVPLTATVYSILQNTYIDRSLKGEARRIWQEISSEPYPRNLVSQTEAVD